MGKCTLTIVLVLLLLSGCAGDSITNEAPRLLVSYPLESLSETSFDMPVFSRAYVGDDLVWFRLNNSLLDPTGKVQVSAQYEYRVGGSSFYSSAAPSPELLAEMRLPAKGVFPVRFIRERDILLMLRVNVGGYSEDFVAIERAPGQYLVTWHHTGASGVDHHFSWVY